MTILLFDLPFRKNYLEYNKLILRIVFHSFSYLITRLTSADIILKEKCKVIEVFNVFLNLPFNNVKLTSLSFLLSSLLISAYKVQDKQTKQVNFIKTSRLKTSHY